jgi:hypothetical protein
MKKTLLFAAILLLFLIPTAPAEESDPKVSAASLTITEAELRDHLFFLASDELGGRGTGSEGFRIAADYAAVQFRQAGLKPLAADSESGESYLQRFPLRHYWVDSSSYITLKTGGDRKKLNLGNQFLPLGGNLEHADFLQVVFVGYGIHEPGTGWDDLAGLDVGGKVALALNGAPVKNGKPVLPESLHFEYEDPLLGAVKKQAALGKAGARALVILPDREISAAWWILRKSVLEDRYAYPTDETSGFDDQGPALIVLSGDGAKGLKGSDGYEPLKFQTTGDFDDYRRGELRGLEIALAVEAVRGTVITTNVVGLVEGSDPLLKEQYVTIGAHLDHLGTNNGVVYNGADDNASGCTAVLEIAEAVASAQPRRSVIFLLYSAEEIGLYGSRYFTENCPVPVDSIVANVNLDMVGRPPAKPTGMRALYAIGSDAICGGMSDIVRDVNARTVNISLNFTGAKMFFTGSDHFNFHKQGIPVVFFFEGLHQDYHMPGDDAEKIDYEGLRIVSQLGCELVLELADRDMAPCALERGR